MSKSMSKEETIIMQEKFTKAFSDKAFAEKVLAMETPEEVRAALLEKDIDLDVEDIIEIKDLMERRLNGGEELSEDDLEDISGGALIDIIRNTILFNPVFNPVLNPIIRPAPNPTVNPVNPSRRW